jgi:hypothetical protein
VHRGISGFAFAQVLPVADVVQERAEGDDGGVEARRGGELGGDVPCEAEDAFDVVVIVRAVVLVHVLFHESGDSRDEVVRDGHCAGEVWTGMDIVVGGYNCWEYCVGRDAVERRVDRVVIGNYDTSNP